MKEQFIPYELALKLKELGFKDECLRTYDEDGNFCTKITQRLYCKAPLWQQAFDWFRTEHNIYFTIDYGIKFLDNSKYWVFDKGYPNNTKYKTYTEARLACLEKLIELVSNENI